MTRTPLANRTVRFLLGCSGCCCCCCSCCCSCFVCDGLIGVRQAQSLGMVGSVGERRMLSFVAVGSTKSWRLVGGVKNFMLFECVCACVSLMLLFCVNWILCPFLDGRVGGLMNRWMWLVSLTTILFRSCLTTTATRTRHPKCEGFFFFLVWLPCSDGFVHL